MTCTIATSTVYTVLSMAFHRCNCCWIEWPGNNRLEYRAHCCESSTSPFTSASHNRFNWTFIFFLLVALHNNHYDIPISRGKSKYIRIQSTTAEKKKTHSWNRIVTQTTNVDMGRLINFSSPIRVCWCPHSPRAHFFWFFIHRFSDKRRGKIDNEKYKKQLQKL